jgi:hypothetical protein
MITDNPIKDKAVMADVNRILYNFHLFILGKKALYELEVHIERLWEILAVNIKTENDINPKEVLKFYLRKFCFVYKVDPDATEFLDLVLEIAILETSSLRKAVFKYAGIYKS